MQKGQRLAEVMAQKAVDVSTVENDHDKENNDDHSKRF